MFILTLINTATNTTNVHEFKGRIEAYKHYETALRFYERFERIDKIVILYDVDAARVTAIRFF